MIYKDKNAKYDEVDCPEFRPGVCVNCGEVYDDHSGWRCPGLGTTKKRSFYDLKPEERFLTAEMRDSVMPQRVPQPSHTGPLGDFLREKLGPSPAPTVDLSDWRAWSHKHPGDCPCGIAKAQCDYHKE